MSLTAIIIDDDSDDLEIMQEAIAEVAPPAVSVPFSHSTKAIHSLLEARKTFVPDYIFVDHNMPEMTGLECIKILKSQKEFNKTVFVALSTSMLPQDSAMFLQAGANFAVRKAQFNSGIQNVPEDGL